MKKTIIITAVFAVFLNINCKKNENTFQSYLRFKLDNVQFECNAHISASYMPPTIGPDNITTISGNWAEGSISLGLQEDQFLAPGTYPFLPFKLRSGKLWITTNPNYGEFYIAGGGGIFDPSVPYSGQIVIQEISPEFIKGSFECVLKDQFGKIKVLDSGEFHIKRR